ncbi:hypothetical protein [Corynebacterium variabile]|uniref:hypothetical protein n=1 Tax=Corynebacterium variabile TaxID=1727 RepID=UPI003F9AD21C
MSREDAPTVDDAVTGSKPDLSLRVVREPGPDDSTVSGVPGSGGSGDGDGV